MTQKVYIDGTLVPKEDAKVSVYDHGLLFGDGVFEGIRVHGGKVFLLPEPRHDIYTADKCFLTGTAAEVVAVISLDGRTIGEGKPGPVTMDLLERFREPTRKGGW
jgi:branched-chain amino acid aminotransferase